MWFLRRQIKGQPALEFLSIYSWALISILLLIAVVTVVATSQGKLIYPPPHCYIAPSFPCYGAYIMTNSIGTVALVILNNNLGVPVYFPANSFEISPSYSNKTYGGQCLPSTASHANTIVCEASLAGFSSSLGTELGPNFEIRYSICEKTCAGGLPVYNTSGTAQLTVSPYSANAVNAIV